MDPASRQLELMMSQGPSKGKGKGKLYRSVDLSEEESEESESEEDGEIASQLVNLVRKSVVLHKLTLDTSWVQITDN